MVRPGAPEQAGTVADGPRLEPGAEVVMLSVPSLAAYGRLARVAASGLLIRHGFSYAELEDLRLAVDEAIILLLGRADHVGRIHVRFGFDDDGVFVEAVAEFDEDRHLWTDEATARFRRLVTELVDDVSLDADHGRVALRKHRSAAA
ncbi:MAG: hypothetical protein S0880_25530 [Actinomycetota bacterium]|nr:hypothetical protein [Actinomycetota bacterium]